MMWAMLLFRCSAAAILLFSSAVAQPWPGLIGAGIGDGLEGSRSKMFVDVARGHRPMGELGKSTAAPVDENGWPTTDASTVVFDIRPVPAWAPPVDDPEQFQPDWSGTYKLSFQGQADLQGYDSSLIHIENLVYDAETNTTRADCIIDPGLGLFWLEFANTRRSPDSDAGTGFTNFKVIRPGYTEDTTQVFTDEFLATLQPFSVIRFMGFLMTNSTNPFYGDARNKLEWSDRRLPTDATQQRTPQRAAGVAWEHAIEICNLTGKDMWLNIPIAATDDYIRELATLLRDTLKPELNIYIENSNEVWNYSFGQYTYNKMGAIDEVGKGDAYLNDPEVRSSNVQEVWHQRRYALRLVTAIRIFGDVFGAEQINQRLRGIYAWWTIKPGEYRSTLEWVKLHFGNPSDLFWAIAKTNYYNDAKAHGGQSPEEVVAIMKNDSDLGRNATGTLKSVSDDYGLRLVTYEAGPDNGGGDTNNIGNRIRANRLPNMGELMKHDFVENWLPLGGDLYMYLEVVSAYSRYGCWGHTEDAANRATPRFRAIYELVGTPQPE